MSLTIDDNDVRVTYAGGLWEALRDSSQQYQSTVHSTWDYDASATVTFTGTGITVFATVPAGVGKTVTTIYILDGKTGITKWNDGQKSAQYNQALYDSGTLSSGTHTLVIKNRGEDNDLDLRLDKLVVQTSQSTAPVTTPTNPSPTAATPVSLQTSTTTHGSSPQETPVVPTPASFTNTTLSRVLSSSMTSASNSGSLPRVTNGGVTSISNVGSSNVSNTASDNPTSTSSKSNLPAILGGIVGVLAFIVLGFIIYLLHRRRRRLKENSLLFANVATPFSTGALPPAQRPHIRLTTQVTTQVDASESALSLPLPENRHHRILHLVSPVADTEKSAFHSFEAHSPKTTDTYPSTPHSPSPRISLDSPPSYQATI